MNNKVIESDVKVLNKKVDLTPLNNKKILITGASGLIGTYLLFSIKEYVNSGGKIDQLYVIINSDLPDHLVEFKEISWVKVIKANLTEYILNNEIKNIDFIIHAAGYAQPKLFMKNPINTLKINTYSLFNLFDILSPDGKLVFVSSSAVYTGSNNLPYSEDDIGNANTNHSRSSYIEGKKCGEAICHAFREKGIDAKSTRFSITYGPGAKKDDLRVLYTFIRNAILNGKIELLDAGNAEKVYCYITDAIEILWNVLFYGTEDIYNVSGDSQVSIIELANKVADGLNAEVVAPQKGDGIPGAIQVEKLSMNRVINEFKKTDYIDIDTGLRRTIEWCKDNWF